MSQRASGYARQDRDEYYTPEWVTLALAPHIPAVERIWEPAAGSGKMVDALAKAGFNVTASDIISGVDFLKEKAPQSGARAIITNPPFYLAPEFVGHAVELMRPANGFVAMLLRTDFDHAKTRNGLFASPAFSKKLVLTKRIVWFERKGAAPSFNHAWFIWDWTQSGPPSIVYDVQP